MSYVDEIWRKCYVEFPFSTRPTDPPFTRRKIADPQLQPLKKQMPKKQGPCPLGVVFNEWCSQALKIEGNPTLDLIKWKHHLLQERYWQFYYLADKECRNHTEEQYFCIHHVYHKWYEKLVMLQHTRIPDSYFELLQALIDMEAEKQQREQLANLWIGDNAEETEPPSEKAS